jgi:hypothetical protein
MRHPAHGRNLVTTGGDYADRLCGAALSMKLHYSWGPCQMNLLQMKSAESACQSDAWIELSSFRRVPSSFRPEWIERAGGGDADRIVLDCTSSINSVVRAAAIQAGALLSPRPLFAF